MPPTAPQVLGRRTNGTAAAGADKSGEPKKAKSEGRSGRRRGRGSRKNDAAQKGDGEPKVPKAPKPKPQIEGVKVVIRRLPPGMTENEFLNILGEEWMAGRGRVDWLSYVTGKISSDPSKPSRPARAYIHLMKREDLMLLDENVRAATWEDAKATFTSPSLVGPPSLEFAVYKKVPLNPRKPDSRAGTIDQDPEFMAFLEELANPAPLPKDPEGDDDEAAKAEPAVTTTPLIEFLKEKKANKGKDSKKRGEKGKGVSNEDDKKKSRDSKSNKAEKSTKESVKVLTKKVPAAEKDKATDTTQKATSESAAASGQDAPKSRRANIAAAARILQRDLGLSPGTAHRRARQDAAKADVTTKPTEIKEAPVVTEKKDNDITTSEGTATQNGRNRPGTPTNTKPQPGSGGRKGRGGKDKPKAPDSQPTAANPPTILKKGANINTPAPIVEPANVAPTQLVAVKGTGNQTDKNAKSSKTSQKKPAAVSTDATKAFVKHVNTSQGVTEAALRETLSVFGAVTAVEVDKRKAFAYVDFADHDGLVKAISASPVTVSRGSVQIMERKDKKAAEKPANAPSSSNNNSGDKEKSNRGRRGRGGGGGGGGSKANANANGQAANPVPTPAAAPATGESG